MKEKTIFIVASQGIIVRNILRTDVLKILQEHNLRIVVFLPNDPPEYYKKEFDYPNLIFEKISKVKRNFFREKFFKHLIQNLVCNETNYLMARYGTPRKKRGLKHFLFWLIWSKPFGNSILMKRFFRFLEIKLFPIEDYAASFFDYYKPALVFAGSVAGNIDMGMVRAAKQRGIKTIAMPKSWDTLDKFLFQTKPDKFIIQNNELKELAVKAQDVSPESIYISGFPQFDIYKDKSIIISRNEFLGSLNLDLSKKVIFFGSGGRWGPCDEDIADILCKFINSNEAALPSSLIIRAHFADIKAKRFDKFKTYPNVYVDDKHQRTMIFHELGDPSREDMAHLANLLYNSDVTINAASTLSLDAACYDKPIVCIAFDGYQDKKAKTINSIEYKTSYYQRIVKTKGIRVAKSAKELKEQINQYLLNPQLDAEGRGLIRNRSCYKLDGQSGKRIAHFLLKEMGLENVDTQTPVA